MSGKLIEGIRVEGFREFRNALKALDGESQKLLRVELNKIAEVVAGAAARRFPSKTGRGRASLRAQSGQLEARVVGGGKKAPYVGWIDFGATRVGRGGGKATRPYLRSGRFIYPALDANREGLEKALQAGLVELGRSVGLEVSDGT